nr:hypothetical protein HK105_002353 [Polyrhizophydium stewartii]
MADDAAATGAAAGIALAAAHRTAPAKPPMLSKDLRLSSADLLNPLSADILQSSSTSASDYTQHDYSARSGHQASPPPGLSSSEFASADEIAMSMYGNGSAFGSGGEHGMPNQQDTHDDLLSMFRTIKGGSLSRDSTRADMLMPQLSRPPSSAGLYDYIAPTGNKTNNAWQHRELSEKRLSYESKRSSQVTLGSSMSSSDPSSLFHSSHGLMDVNSASFTSSGTAAQHRGNIRPGINPAIDSIPEEYMQSHLYDPMPPIHMADASPDLQDAATRQSEAWSLTHAFAPSTIAGDKPAEGAGDTMHPSQLIGTASFSRSFMERLGESSENNLASVPLEISQQEESISTNIRKLVQDQLNIGASETPSARSSAKQSHSDAGANATGGESTAPKQQAQGQQPMQVEKFDHDGFQMQSPTAMHSIATQQQAQSFYHAQRVQGFQTPQQGSLPLLADGQSDSFARRDEAQQAMQGVHNNDGGLASPTTNIAQLEATFTHVSQQPSTFLQPHPQIGQTLPGDSMHFMTQATIPTQAMQAQLLDRSLHGVGADSHAAKRQQLRRRGSPGDALPVFSTHLLLQSTSSSPMVLPVKLQTPRLAMASTMTPAFFPQPQPQPQVGHHDEASALATHSALQAAAWGIQAGIASANAGTCSGGPVSNLMNSVGGACGRRKLIERPFYCNRCSVEIGTIFVRGNDNAAQIEALMSVSCARCESQPGRSLRNSNQSGSQLDLQSTHISNDAFSLSGGAGSGSCGAGSAGGSAGGTAMSGSDPARSASGASKKRSRSSVPTIDCEVCKRTLGIGLLARMGISPSMGGGCIRQGGKDGAGSAAFAAAQGAEDLKPEYVCKPCCQTYMFCSECGGGGKQRTGKWRPKELFERGRRTCSLPHVRVGNALVNYQVLDVSSELTPDVLNGIQDVFYDCMISLYAVPAIIQSPKYGSYVSVRADLEQLWRTSVMDFVVPGMDEGTIQLSSDGASATTSIPTQVPAYCRRFLTVAWMDKRHRNKGKGKFSVKENISWLRRIEIGQAAEMTDAAMSDGPGDAASTAAAPATGKVFGPQVSSVGPHAMLSPSPVTQTVPLPPAPPARSSSQSQMQSQSQAATSSSSASSGTPARGPAASHHTSHDDPNKSFVAFSVLEWDLRLNTIFFAQMAPRSVFLKTMGQYIDLLNVGIHRVLAEARAANLPPPQVVWCWTRSDHARLQSVPARLGFQPHQQFLSENPDVSPHIFARDDFAPLEMEGALVFAQTIQTFVSQRAPPHTVG